MFNSIDPTTQLYLFIAIAMLAYFIAAAMNGVMGPDGFGVLGNQAIVITGFYLGVWLARYYRMPIQDFTKATIAGLLGAFISLLVLSVLKAVLNRLA